ncbi:MAG: hypothetical protein HQK51_12635, partial [Oligoflexia bacterium]|nr:hypothetical protein [Oligoflexia bacterium]
DTNMNELESYTGSPYGDLAPDGCYLENSPYQHKNLIESGFADFLKKQRELLATCVQTVVTNTSENLIVPANQFDCSFKMLNKNQAVMKGGHCYVRIGSRSTFKYKIEINPDCNKREFLKQNKITPMEIKLQYNMYVSTNTSGHDPRMTTISNINGRIVLIPGKELLPSASYIGTGYPNWATLAGAHVDLAEMSLSLIKKNTTAATSGTTIYNNTGYILKLPFTVSNKSSNFCNDGICTSPSYFKFPAVAEVILKKKKSHDQQYKIIDQWYQGAIILPGFFGVIGLERRIPHDDIKKGDVYIVEVKFSDITMSYNMFKDGLKQMLINLEEYLASGTTELGELGEIVGEIGTIGGFSEDIPELPETVVGGTIDTNAQLLNASLEKL